MRKGLSLLLAGVVTAATLAAAPATANAYWHRGWGGGYGYHHGWVGPGIVAGALGLGAAAVIASQPHYVYAAPAYAPTYYAPPPPPVVVQPAPYGYYPAY
jgi:hypothetical protein